LHAASVRRAEEVEELGAGEDDGETSPIGLRP